ncbi:Thyroglobulin 1 domain containing protein, partial [Asbolus verrucosus]
MAASRRAKALGVEAKSVRMPRCSKSGGFEPVQCDNEIISSCWCVDEAGFELPGTRAPAAALVNCT